MDKIPKINQNGKIFKRKIAPQFPKYNKRTDVTAAGAEPKLIVLSQTIGF